MDLDVTQQTTAAIPDSLDGSSTAPTPHNQTVADILEKGYLLPASARLAKIMTEHDERVKYHAHLPKMAELIAANAEEARRLIKTETFSPMVEKEVDRSRPDLLLNGTRLTCALEIDVRKIEPLLATIIGSIGEKSMMLDFTQLKPLVEIIEVVHHHGKLRVNKVFITLRPPPKSAE